MGVNNEGRSYLECVLVQRGHTPRHNFDLLLNGGGGAGRTTPSNPFLRMNRGTVLRSIGFVFFYFTIPETVDH